MDQDLSRRARGALFTLLALGLLLRVLLAWAPFSYLASRGSLVDDAFYSFSIARHVAAGHGPTADGIHPTSGFQPLYTFLLVPFYLLSRGDSILPIHLALTLLAVAGAATGVFIFRIVWRSAGVGAALFSLFLWTFAPYFLSEGQNGLETGLFGLALAATLDFYLRRARENPRHADLGLLGLLLGATILARVDGVLFAAAVAADQLLAGRGLRTTVPRVARTAAIALATVSPYLLFLWLRFGVLLPESGAAVRFLSLCYGTLFVLGPRSAYFFPPEQAPWAYYAGSLRKAVQILISEPLLFPASLPLYLASVARLFNPRTLLLIFGGGALLGLNLLPLARSKGEARSLLRVGATCAVLWVPAYAWGVLGQWWFNRYFFPLFLLMAIASGLVLARIASSPLGRIGPTRLAWIAAGAHLLLFAHQAPEHFFKHHENVSSYIQAAQVLDRSLPVGSRGGAFQSGTIGYFARHPVINLDGVVNRDAARALREARMADYIREEGIEAVIDWPLWLEALLIHRSPEGAGRSLGPVTPAGRFLLLRVEPAGNRVARLAR
jgi:dolichyl-phosphate-mannose-protein mannosyltransferase